MTTDVVHSAKDLLKLTGCSTLSELEDQVVEHLDVDAYLVDRSMEDPPGVEVQVLPYGVLMDFPFSIREFWEAADEMFDLVYPAEPSSDE